MRVLRSNLLVGSCLSVAALFPGSTWAAPEKPSNTSASASSDQEGRGQESSSASGTTSSAAGINEGTLNEIIVTAQHRASDVQKTSAAIAVLGGDQLTNAGNMNINDALRTVPAVQVKDDPNGSVIVIRGVQPVFNTDPTVNVNVDGVYQLYPGSMPNFDLERVEVLKGPQGTQYGRNALGGVVNFVNKTPGNELGGQASLQYGNYNAIRAEGAVDLPITEGVSARVAALRSQHEGYLSNGNSDERTTAVRGTLQLKPTEDLRILLEGEFDHFGGHGFGTVPAPLSSHSSDPWYTDSTHTGAQDTDNKFGNLRVDWDLHAVRLYAQAAIQRYHIHVDQDLQGPAYGFGAGEVFGDSEVYELRISSPTSSDLQWQVGYYRFHGRSEVVGLPDPLITSVAHPLAATATGSISTTTSNAGYATATYPVTEKFRLTGGIRYTEDDKDQRTNGYDTSTGDLTFTFYDKKRFSAFTYETVAEYDVALNSMVYGKVSRGFKAGGLNAPGVTPSSYKPEVINAFEVGSKNEFFGRKLRVNFDAFYYNDKNKQVQLVSACDPLAVPSSCPFPVTATTNASKATIYGAELQTVWNFTRKDQILLDVAYTHARFDELQFTVYNPPVIQVVDRSGTQLPNAPTWTATAGYQHTFDFNDGGELTPFVNARYSSGYDSDVNFNYIDQRQPKYVVLNALLTYRPGRKFGGVDWSVSAYINNITNVAIRQRANIGNRLYLDRPQTFGGTLNLKF